MHCITPASSALFQWPWAVVDVTSIITRLAFTFFLRVCLSIPAETGTSSSPPSSVFYRCCKLVTVYCLSLISASPAYKSCLSLLTPLDFWHFLKGWVDLTSPSQSSLARQSFCPPSFLFPAPRPGHRGGHGLALGKKRHPVIKTGFTCDQTFMGTGSWRRVGGVCGGGGTSHVHLTQSKRTFDHWGTNE